MPETLRSIVLLGIYAGLRINAEALTLKKQSVDLVRKRLTIEAAYSKNRETPDNPLHSKLVEPLRHFLESGEGSYCSPIRQAGAFCSVRTAFTNACQRANLSDVTPHTPQTHLCVEVGYERRE